jgi:SulP family sulfate permease
MVLAVTFLATLAIRLDVAIFIGVIASLLVYLSRTTRPQLTPVAPEPGSRMRRFVPVADIDDAVLRECPQLIMLRVDGSLFFGAVEHVRHAIDAARSHSPSRRHLLLVGTGINFIDVAGAELLVQEAKLTRDAGGELYLCNLKPAVLDVLKRGGFLDRFGRERVFDDKDHAIRAIYARLDAGRCRVCEAQIFNECKVTLPDGTPRATAVPSGINAAARNP